MPRRVIAAGTLKIKKINRGYLQYEFDEIISGFFDKPSKHEMKNLIVSEEGLVLAMDFAFFYRKLPMAIEDDDIVVDGNRFASLRKLLLSEEKARVRPRCMKPLKLKKISLADQFASLTLHKNP